MPDITNFITAEGLKSFAIQATIIVVAVQLLKDIAPARLDAGLKLAAFGFAVWMQIATYLGGAALGWTLIAVNAAAVALVAMTTVEKLKAKKE
jgi:hypothetical protein